MKNVTLCTVACNGLDAVSLMWESYMKYHDRPVLFAYDNNSGDGTRQYLEKHADFLYKSNKNDYHGPGLDYLCKRVETEYLLTVDTDVEFLQATVPMMISQNAFAVHNPRTGGKIPQLGNIGGTVYEWCERFRLYTTLFKTADLKMVLERLSFSSYRNDEKLKFWDTSGMIYQITCLLGHKIAEVDLTQYVKHYESVTLNTQWLNHDPERRHKGSEKLATIRQRLLKLRGTPDPNCIPMG